MDDSGGEERQLRRDYLTCPDSLSWGGFNCSIFIAWKEQRFAWEAWGNPATHSPTHLFIHSYCDVSTLLRLCRSCWQKDNRKRENESKEEKNLYCIVERRAFLEAGDSLSLKLADPPHIRISVTKHLRSLWASNAISIIHKNHSKLLWKKYILILTGSEKHEHITGSAGHSSVLYLTFYNMSYHHCHRRIGVISCERGLSHFYFLGKTPLVKSLSEI